MYSVFCEVLVIEVLHMVTLNSLIMYFVAISTEVWSASDLKPQVSIVCG